MIVCTVNCDSHCKFLVFTKRRKAPHLRPSTWIINLCLMIGVLSGGRERDDCMLDKLRFALHVILFNPMGKSPSPPALPLIINLCLMTGVLSVGGSGMIL